jgi:transcription initiation factor TFIIB
MNKCPECGGFLETSAHAEVICAKCGLVLEDTPLNQDIVPEVTKRTADHPVLATAASRGVDGRIYKAHWLQTTREKNMGAGFRKIELLASQLKLPERAQYEARILFKRALEADLGIGRDLAILASASIYTSCQINGIPKTAREIIIHSGVGKTDLLRCHKAIKSTLGLRVQATDPIDLVPRFASRLQLRQDTQLLALEILSKLKDTAIAAGRRPETLTAATLYLASKVKNDLRTQRDIANTIGVIEVTIRKRSKEIEQLIPGL